MPMSITQRLVHHNAAHPISCADLPTEPASKLAVVACMDSRMDVFQLLGLRIGEAHIIRNAGGVVTDDVIRSLAISQWRLDTEHIILLHHTRCGLRTFTDAEFKAQMRQEVGVTPEWSVECFEDESVDVHESKERIKRSPFIRHTHSIRGFVVDVDTGLLHEVD